MRKLVTFVCLANYCRSPVAKVLFEKNFSNEYEFISVGLNPMSAFSQMDPRSRKFLEELDIKDTLHTPKKINLNIVRSSDIIFALDIKVLFELNRLYKNFSNKIKLLSHQNNKLNLSDPYKQSDDEYKSVMLNIKGSLRPIIFK